ncbi:MAG: MFS transporter [Spirochaeta sp.]|nr:MFS transporter [Spirochaeta sp.]
MRYFHQRRTRAQVVLSGLGKTAVIYPSAFLVAVGEGLLGLGLIYFMREIYGATPGLIGLLVGAGTLVYALSCLFLRPLSDSILPRFLMIGATAGMSLSLVLLYLFRSIPLTFVFFGLYKLALSFFWPPAMGWLSQNIEGKVLNKTMSRFNLSWSLGLVASQNLAGLLSERSPLLPILAAVLVCCCCLLLITGAALALPAIRGDNHREKQNNSEVQKINKGTSLRFTAWIGLFTSFIAIGVLVTIFPQFAQDNLNISKSLVGNIFSVRMFSKAVGFFLIERLSFWHFKGRYQLLSLVVLAVLLGVMTQAQSVPLFIILFTLVALTNTSIFTNSVFHGVVGSTSRAGRMAIHESLLSGGHIVGSTAGGMLYQHFSFTITLFFCIGCTVTALLAQIILLIRFRRAAS